jgi:hypothetical protein
MAARRAAVEARMPTARIPPIAARETPFGIGA